MTEKFQHLGRFISHLIGAVALVLAVLAPGDARSAWPERTVTIIVPFPPGGPNDLLGRLLAT
ncbi:MAG TPA: tripartite tricarboxylate transporter substrate binding protein, partial [Burkholderiales bacterium]|nr:tripartite tricarboxylate transporter substrate binding protein [Burkholderiales bacterium]